MSKNTTVLVTGGLGYIGSHTVVELLSQGYEVVIIDDVSNSHPQVKGAIETASNQQVSCFFGHFADPNILNKVFEQHPQINAVIHFAAYKYVAESIESPIDYYQNNVAATIEFIGFLKQQSVRNIIFSSSAAVYGEPSYFPIDEKHPCNPANPYGESKLIVEKLLKDLVVSDHNWRVTNLRYFNPLGAHKSGLIGENGKHAAENIMPVICKVASGKQASLSIFGDDYDTKDGTGVRDYLHVVDLACGHIKALEHNLQTNGCHTFNLGTGNGISVLELVKAFIDTNKVTVPVTVKPRRKNEVAQCFSSAKLAQKELNWQCQKSLNDMVKDAWLWYQKLTSH